MTQCQKKNLDYEILGGVHPMIDCLTKNQFFKNLQMIALRMILYFQQHPAFV